MLILHVYFNSLHKRLRSDMKILLYNQVGDLSRKGWKEVTGINTSSGGEYYSGGYGDSYQQQQSPGERSSLVNGSMGYNRDDEWSCTSQQGSK